MNQIAFPAGIFLLAGFVLLPSAFAQIVTPPTPAAPPVTLKDIQIEPPTLTLFPIVRNSDLQFQFQEKEGALLLTQPPMMWGGDKRPDGQVFWSGQFGAKPFHFTLEATASGEDIKDDAGKTLWSQPFEKPSLTLDFARRNHIRLLDSDGKELGFAPTDESYPLVYPAHHHKEPFFGSTMRSEGIQIETDTRRRQTTVTSGTQLIWSGHRPPNDGVQFGRSADSSIEGIPTPGFPAGTAFTFEVTRETGSMSILDGNHHVLETAPTETLRLTIFSDDEQFHKNNWFLFRPQEATTEAKLNAPGEMTVEYRTAEGEGAGKEVIHSVVSINHFPDVPQNWTYLNSEATRFDKTGKLIGTFGTGSRLLRQN